MGNGGIDFDEIMVDDTFGVENEEEESEEEAEPVLKFAPMKPITRPLIPAMPSPFPAREALTLVEEPEKLFDFSKSKLNPQQQMYILHYAVKGTKAAACRGASVPYSVVEKWNEDETFTKALQEAISIAQDALEEELLRRAMNGSDKLLIEAIRASKPEKYGRTERKDVNINGTVVHTWADLANQANSLGEPEKPEFIEAEFEGVEESEEN